MQKTKIGPRLLAVLLALIMALGMLPFSALADWDGATYTQPPTDSNGDYLIGTADELMWFSQNAGRTDSALLTADIVINSDVTSGTPHTWTPIGGTSDESYQGTFDGQGYSISGLYITSGAYKGLFGYIGAAGVVKDLTITNSSITGTGYLGLVAGSNAGTVSGITVKESKVATVANQTHLGGIIGTNSGIVIACANLSATVTQTIAADGSSAGTGGIVGTNTGSISLSFNNAEVKNGDDDDYDGYNGGIAGYSTSAGTIDFCYNTGNIGMAYRSGGIAGANSGTITNSYNIGTVNQGGAGSATSPRGGGISVTGGTVSNSYYLEGCVGGGASSYGIAKTAEDIKALAPDLGGAFEDDLTSNINGGYPILQWQNPYAVLSVTLTVIPTNATVTLTPNGGGAISPDSNTGGVYVFSGLATGTYEYTVSETVGDYIPETGEITVKYGSVSKTVTLVRKTYDIQFNVTPADAVVSITTAGFEQSKTAVGGVATFSLPMGTYAYSVEKFGYAGVTGSVTVLQGSGIVQTTETLTENSKHNLAFSVTPGGATIIVTHPTQGEQTPISGAVYDLYEGETYNYAIRLSGYVTARDTVTIGSGESTITVVLAEGISSWDGVTVTEPQQLSGVYQIVDAENLAWFRDKVNSELVLGSGGNAAGVANNSTSSKSDAILLNDIDLDSHEWLPIGTYVNSQASYYGVPYGYAGTFDGNGKTISGLSITTGADGSGLFGVVYGGGVVKNLTVEGNITVGQYSGGIAGIAQGGGSSSTITPAPASGATITNCTSYVNITVNRNLGNSSNNIMVGGITGGLNNHASANTHGVIEYCTNYGTIIGGPNSYIGGIVGNASNGIGVLYCSNEGDISGQNEIGGIVGDHANVLISGCYNAGSVTGTGTYVGGIAGYSNRVTRSSYNTGAVSGQGQVGGIVGRLLSANGIISGSYNTGAVSGTGSATGDTCGAIVGAKGETSQVIFNSFYLAGTAAVGIGSNANALDSAVSVTAAELQKLSTTARLGGAFVYIAGDYPLLRWQTGGTDVAILFDVTPDDAAITVRDSANQDKTPGEGANCYLLPMGGYTYEIIKTDYKPVIGTLAVSETNDTVINVVMAAATAPSAPVNITMSYQADATGFQIAPKIFNVGPGLSEEYGYDDDFDGLEITALDAIVAAHIAVYGDNKTTINNALSLGSNGYLSSFMGDGTGYFLYFVNGVLSNDSAGEMLLSDGDEVQLFALKDTAVWTDVYAWFEANGGQMRTMTATAGVPFDLTVEASSWGVDIGAISGAGIVQATLNSDNTALFDAPLATTDANGKATVTLASAGTYYLSAVNVSGAAPLMSPWLVVTVGPAPSGAADITISYQADATGFSIAPKTLSVSPGLSEEYGYTDTKNGLELTALDAIVAAHIAVYGDNRAVINSVLAVTANGAAISNFMGEGMDYMYFVNGVAPDVGPGEKLLNSGDVVQMFLMKDAFGYSDVYTWFEAGGLRIPTLTVAAGVPEELVIMGDVLDLYTWQTFTTEIGGAGIVQATLNPNGSATFGATPLATTDANGKATVTLASAGTYYLSAVNISGAAPLMSPWLVVTVTETGGPTTPVTLAGITVTSTPDKTVYTAGEALNLAGLAVRANYDDNSSRVIMDYTISLASGAILNTVGTVQVTVSYTENNVTHTAAFTITVNEKPPEPTTYETALRGALGWIRANTTSPAVSSGGGEWAVLALARAEVDDDSWYDAYLAALDAAIINGNYELTRWTDYQRVTLALTAMGLDASDYNGYDLTQMFAAYTPATGRPSGSQTLNADIYALIALNAKPYAGDQQMYVDAILAAEISGGGWNLAGNSLLPATVDITAMAIQALAPYYYIDPDVQASVDRALAWLNGQQASDVEGLSQIIVALSTLGIDAASYVDDLLGYYDAATGGFRRNNSVNDIATEQAAYALVAYARYKSGLNSLYDMGDAGSGAFVIPVSKTALNTEIARAEGLRAGDYTSATWNVVQSALTAAKTVAADANATQIEVDTAKNSLETAINALVTQGGGGGQYPTRQTATISVIDEGATGSQKKIYFAAQAFELNSGETALSLLRRTGLAIVTTGSSGNEYVVSIDGYGEFSDGPLSGWMYKVNGVFPESSSGQRMLNGGDLVEWVYTRDLGNDVGGSGSTGGGGGGGAGAGAGKSTDASTPAPDEITEEENSGAAGMNDPAQTGMANPARSFVQREWTNKFIDIAADAWYFEAVKYAFENSLMNGVSDTVFSPNGKLTMAMLVTILARSAGIDTEGGSTWYEKAVAWGMENGVTDGTDTMGDISRQRFITILYRYAQLLGYDTSKRADLSEYDDFGEIADWAYDAVSWAVAEGLVNGRTSTTLAPLGNTTRAETAILLMRFFERF